jgi:proteic killer suppression protein
MLLPFADKDTEAIFHGRAVPRLSVELQEHAFRKLRYLDAAVSMASLQAVPGLRCKKLGGQRKGQPDLWSIRVNDQWRITFTTTEPPLEIRNVELTDYH